MNIKYLLGSIITIPLLPFMYFHGKRIRTKIPQLPEAKAPEGKAIFATNTYQTFNIITLGESTIAGVGVETHEDGFAGSLARTLTSIYQANIKWKVYARSGYTAKRVTQKLIPRINEKHLDLIVIGLGGNNAFTLSSPRKWRNDILELISELRKKYPDTTIVFCNMPPIKDFPAFTKLIKFTIGNLVEILGAELKKITGTMQNVFYHSDIIKLENWIKILESNFTASDFFSDGVHPSKLTCETWGKEMAEFIGKTCMIKKEDL